MDFPQCETISFTNTFKKCNLLYNELGMINDFKMKMNRESESLFCILEKVKNSTMKTVAESTHFQSVGFNEFAICFQLLT